MSQPTETDLKVLHALIDELILYIDMLKRAPHDRHMAELFGKRFLRFGLLLSDCGYTELSKLTYDVHGAFSRFFNRSIYTTHELLQTALSLLVLARKSLMFSDAPDFNEIAGAMMFELRQTLGRLSESPADGRVNPQNNPAASGGERDQHRTARGLSRNERRD